MSDNRWQGEAARGHSSAMIADLCHLAHTAHDDDLDGLHFVAPTGRRCYAVTGSPLGELVVLGDGEAVVQISLLRDVLGGPGIDPAWIKEPAPLADAVTQLGDYFAGRLTAFKLTLAPGGTPFQQQVWRHLARIPYGTTTTYGDIARAIGRPSAFRAVGAANGRNPIPIILPCHRVIAGNGSLIKYGLGGLSCKRQLLDLEQGR
jgi:O-6-methylguanine DNA methyltransferase